MSCEGLCSGHVNNWRKIENDNLVARDVGISFGKSWCHYVYTYAMRCTYLISPFLGPTIQTQTYLLFAHTSHRISREMFTMMLNNTTVIS